MRQRLTVWCLLWSAASFSRRETNAFCFETGGYKTNTKTLFTGRPVRSGKSCVEVTTTPSGRCGDDENKLSRQKNDESGDKNNASLESSLSSYEHRVFRPYLKSIGVDYGTVRTGIAVTCGYSPRPITILLEKNATELATKICRMCVTEGAEQIVLGLPLDKDGTETLQAKITRDFAAILSAACMEKFGPDFWVWLWDERYTSKAAAARIFSSNPQNDNSWALLDADSACIILEDCYSKEGEGAELVTIPDHVKNECLKTWERAKRAAERVRLAATEQRFLGLDAREEAMRRAKEMEFQMARDGILGTSKKREKKNNKRRKKKPKQWMAF